MMLKPDLVKKYFMELLGTMFFVLAISLTGNPIAIGSMLAVLVYMGEHISGGHYNPAITLAVWFGGKFPTMNLIYYVVCQILGGFLAAGVHYNLTGQRYFPVPADGVTWTKIFSVELLFTFVLCFVFMTVTLNRKLRGNYIYGLAIGFAFMSIAFLGGTYNPAVCLGPTLYDAIFRGTAIQFMPTYVLGALAGGVVASFVYQYLNDSSGM